MREFEIIAKLLLLFLLAFSVKFDKKNSVPIMKITYLVNLLHSHAINSTFHNSPHYFDIRETIVTPTELFLFFCLEYNLKLRTIATNCNKFCTQTHTRTPSPYI